MWKIEVLGAYIPRCGNVNIWDLAHAGNTYQVEVDKTDKRRGADHVVQ